MHDFYGDGMLQVHQPVRVGIRKRMNNIGNGCVGIYMSVWMVWRIGEMGDVHILLSLGRDIRFFEWLILMNPIKCTEPGMRSEYVIIH